MIFDDTCKFENFSRPKENEFIIIMIIIIIIIMMKLYRAHSVRLQYIVNHLMVIRCIAQTQWNTATILALDGRTKPVSFASLASSNTKCDTRMDEVAIVD